MKLVDAHVHLPAYPDPLYLVEMARSTATTLISCTVNLVEAGVNLRMREADREHVRSFVGVHPSDVDPSLEWRQLSEKMVGDFDGVGEIGLDPKYSEVSGNSPQMKAFLDQLSVAERTGKPVQVHSRGSEAECLDALSSFRLRSVLMHWFEGEDRIATVVSRGYFVSVGPAVLYSKRLRRLAANIPLDRILTESDGPVSYAPIGGRSGPGLVPSVLFALAEVTSSPFEGLARVVEENLSRYLSGSQA